MLTCAAERPECVFIEGESHLQGMGPHILVEDVTPRKVEKSTVVLVMRNQPVVTQSSLIYFSLHWPPVWMVDCMFLWSHSRTLQLYRDVTIAGKWLPNFGLCLVLTAFEQGVIFVCYENQDLGGLDGLIWRNPPPSFLI